MSIVFFPIPVSSKELKESAPAINFFFKTLLLSFLIVEFCVVVVAPIIYSLSNNESLGLKEYLGSMFGVALLFSWFVALVSVFIAGGLTIYKFRKQIKFR